VLKIAALVLATAAGVMPAAAPASSSSRTVPTSTAVPASRVVSSSTATSSSNLASNAAWWEKVTVTISGDGKAQSCLYQSSLKPNDQQDCDVGTREAAVASTPSSKGELTRITFERRFSPGAVPQKSAMQTGDTLLGGQVMALGIDGHGAVKTCKIVAVSGEMRPDYGCSEASAERFDASVRGPRTTERDGYMTIIVYGHSEHMV
jgi:hypothetical protein